MTYFLYILQCSDKKLYIGTTTNLPKRIKIHNAGEGPNFTKERRPVKLVYKEIFNDLTSARRREKQLKNWRLEKKINLIKFGYLNPKKKLLIIN